MKHIFSTLVALATCITVNSQTVVYAPANVNVTVANSPTTAIVVQPAPTVVYVHVAAPPMVVYHYAPAPCVPVRPAIRVGFNIGFGPYYNHRHSRTHYHR